VQTAIYNKLYQSPKVPQTDPGVHSLLTAGESVLSQYVQNGLIAPGVWDAPGFGNLAEGQYLPKGWYSYAASVDTQSAADREARISPLLMFGIKLAGAIHFANVLINVVR
jgi:hypothetical protein